MAFAVLYGIARAWGLALFTVYPSLGIVLLGMRRSRDVVDPAIEFIAPEMYWYGWTATAAIGALMFGLVATFLPERWWCRLWPGSLWLVPMLAMVACGYLNIPWLRR